METENQVRMFDGEKYVTKVVGYDANGSTVEEILHVEHHDEPHHNLD